MMEINLITRSTRKLLPNFEKLVTRDYNGDNKKDIFCSVSGGIGVWKNTSNETVFLLN